jgi:hypothetical protein
MNKIIEAFNNLGALYRHLIVASTMLAAIWAGALWVFNPHIKAYAQEEVLEILEEKGITPEAFAGIQKKVDEIAKEQKLVGGIVDELKKQSAEQKTDIGLIKQETAKNGKQLDRIVDFLIEKQP